MKKLLLLLSAFLFCCTQDNPSYETDSYPLVRKIEICHNPQSKDHKKLCSEECFTPDLDEYSFCWTLWPSDCIGPLTYEWQKQNCHFFD